MKKIIRYGIILIMLCAMLISGCSSPEEKAQAEYQRIVAIEKAGDFDQALALYEALAKEYPDTPAGRLASKARVRVVALKKTQQLLSMQKHIESLRMVLTGYQTMYGQFPKAVQDLDDGNYFFDSKYLAETVPADGRIYLLLAGPQGTRFWATKQGDTTGYEAGMTGGVQPVAPDTLEARLAANYRVKNTIGNLVILENH